MSSGESHRRVKRQRFQSGEEEKNLTALGKQHRIDTSDCEAAKDITNRNKISASRKRRVRFGQDHHLSDMGNETQNYVCDEQYDAETLDEGHRKIKIGKTGMGEKNSRFDHENAAYSRAALKRLENDRSGPRGLIKSDQLVRSIEQVMNWDTACVVSYLFDFGKQALQ